MIITNNRPLKEISYKKLNSNLGTTGVSGTVPKGGATSSNIQINNGEFISIEVNDIDNTKELITFRIFDQSFSNVLETFAVENPFNDNNLTVIIRNTGFGHPLVSDENVTVGEDDLPWETIDNTNHVSTKETK